MAILFYDDISLDGQQIQNVSLERLSDAEQGTAATYQGRIIYNTTDDVLKYYNGSNWVALDGTGNIDSVTAGNGLTLSGADPQSTGAVTISVDYGATTNIIAQAPAASGTIATDSLMLVALSTAVEAFPLSNIKTLLNAGVSQVTSSTTTGAGVSTTVTNSGVGSVTLGATLNNSGSAPTAGQFYSGLGTWVTPDPDTNSTYTLNLTDNVASGVGGRIVLIKDQDSTETAVDIIGTANQVTVTPAESTDVLTLSLPSALIAPGSLGVLGSTTVNGATTLQGSCEIAGLLTVTGSATFSSIPTIPPTPATATDAASKGYVDGLVVGGLVFQGSYDADLDPALLSAGSVLKGETFVVNDAGNYGGFWDPALEIGDMIIAKQNSPTLVSHWVAIQKNITFATSTVAGTAKFHPDNGFGAMGANGAATMANHGALGPFGSASALAVVETNAFGSVISMSEQTIAITSNEITDFEDVVDGRLAVNSDNFTINGNNTGVFTYSHTIPAGVNVLTQVYRTATAGTDTIGATVYPAITTVGSTVTVTFKDGSYPQLGDNYKVLLIGTDAA